MHLEKTDTRKLNPAIQQQLRHQVIRLRKAGKTYKEIGGMVGVHPTNACKWFKAYEAHGIQAVQSRKRGRKIGSCRTLRRDQEKRLQKAIAGSSTVRRAVGLRGSFVRMCLFCSLNRGVTIYALGRVFSGWLRSFACNATGPFRSPTSYSHPAGSSQPGPYTNSHMC
jgi:transposase